MTYIYRYTALFFTLVFSQLEIFAYIKQIHSFKEAAIVLADADENTLALFDVDATLTVPRSPLRWPANVAAHGTMLSQFCAPIFKKSTKPEEYFRSIVMTKEVPLLVEDEIVTIIKDLQARNVPVFALTAIMTGGYHTIPSLPEWRFDRLKAIDIDFRSNRFADVVFDHLRQATHSPLFYKGILCSAEVCKGATTGAFLDHVQWIPNRVIFFDDNLQKILEVGEEMARRNIPFIGYHYHGAKRLVGNIDLEVAAIQLRHLVEHEQWLAEEEALQLLSSAA